VPRWLTIVGWFSVVLGGLGLWRGAMLLLRDGTQARDSTGRDGRLVLVDGVGLVLVGAAVLLGGGWVHLIWPAVLLLSIGVVHSVSDWLRTRWRRPPVPVRDAEQSTD